MSKADELLPTLVAGLEWAMRKIAVSPNEYSSELYRREYHAANNVLFVASAYLNEKPHEPIKDTDMVESGHPDERIGGHASPPHAAAEPEKPVAWLYADRDDREAIITRTRWNVCEYPWTETPLYASPSAQPIAEHTHRWNVEESDNDVRICRGFHQSGEQCEWEYFVPKTAAQPIAREPTKRMLETAYIMVNAGEHDLCNVWRAMYDAALKSAGKE